ncbi:MAG TPA: AraC family transcriptional regulator [Polyangiaceae bacterium]|nr:AraC family transcriptional regulator [Polyangiaceae bacterium]
MNQSDNRLWIETDRPGEWLTLARPNPSMELMSVTGSTRLWTEVHTQVCMALVSPGQRGVEAKWRTRARTLTARPGSMMLIEPGDVHATQAVNKPADFDVVRFVPDVLENAMRELELAGSFHFKSPESADPAVAQVMMELVWAQADGAEAFQLAALSAELVSLMVSSLRQGLSESGIVLDPVRDFRLRRVKEYLRANLRQKPCLDELATELDISKYRLCTIFKAAYGVSVGQYWMAARMAEASRLLLAGTPIKMVTAALGFIDEAFFTRTFRRHRTMPPAAWVRLQQQNSRRPRSQPLANRA